MKKNNIQNNGNSRQRFSIRKYSIGTVSVLATTFFIASGNVSFASESSSNELTNEQTSAKHESNRAISPSVTNENLMSNQRMTKQKIFKHNHKMNLKIQINHKLTMIAQIRLQK